MEWLDLTALAEVGEDQFSRIFGDTPLRRPGVVVMRRNAEIAAANGADAT
jgi:epoxyqueuosine reductase QueG